MIIGDFSKLLHPLQDKIRPSWWNAKAEWFLGFEFHIAGDAVEGNLHAASLDLDHLRAIVS